MTNKVDEHQKRAGRFALPIRIYYEDTDAGGIVYYANYLKFAERARTEFLRYIGFDQHSRLESERCGFVVRRLDADYKASAVLDDLVHVTCEVTAVRGACVEIFQQVLRGEEVLAQMNVSVVYVSLSKKRPVRMPVDLIEKLAL